MRLHPKKHSGRLVGEGRYAFFADWLVEVTEEEEDGDLGKAERQWGGKRKD